MCIKFSEADCLTLKFRKVLFMASCCFFFFLINWLSNQISPSSGLVAGVTCSLGGQGGRVVTEPEWCYQEHSAHSSSSCEVRWALTTWARTRGLNWTCCYSDSDRPDTPAFQFLQAVRPAGSELNTATAACAAGPVHWEWQTGGCYAYWVWWGWSDSQLQGEVWLSGSQLATGETGKPGYQFLLE